MAHKYHLSSIIPYLQPTHPLPPPFAFTMAHKYHLSSIIPYLQPTHPLPPPFAFTMAHENVFYAGQHPSHLQISVFNFTTSLHHSLYVWYKMVKLKFHDVARIKEYVVTCLIVFFPKFIPFRLSKNDCYFNRSDQTATADLQHHAYEVGFSQIWPNF